SATLAADLAKVHGDEAARKIIEDAAKSAPETGKKAGKVTETTVRKSERKVTGKKPVVGRAPAAKKGAAKSGSAEHSPPAAPAKSGSVSATLALLHRPFHVTPDG